MSMDRCKKLPALLLALLALALPGLAQADGTGFMLTAGAYYTQIDDDLDGDKIDWGDIGNLEELKAKFDDDSYGFNAGVGWRFNKWLAVDAGYWDLGEFKSDLLGNDRADIEFTTISVGGMVSVPLWVLDVYARGGAAFWDADTNNYEDDGTDPYYGLGAALNVGGSLDFYLEWVRFDFETAIDSFGLGARFTF